MLGFIAAIIFAIAFLISVTSTSTDAFFAPSNLLLLGLFCLALHLADVGKTWGASARSRYRR